MTAFNPLSRVRLRGYKTAIVTALYHGRRLIRCPPINESSPQNVQTPSLGLELDPCGSRYTPMTYSWPVSRYAPADMQILFGAFEALGEISMMICFLEALKPG